MLGQALDAHEHCTVLVAPTAATAAPRLGANARAVGPDGAPVDLVAAVLRFTAPFNITGQPALALPTGLSTEGMPLSMQIIGKPFDEATVIRVAAAYEAARGELPAPRL
jgi:aspartyl-tRNA(Asn)/glutamyl-tRNA(Gln) amidotransferase subunit A